MEKRSSELEPRERGVITRITGTGTVRRRMLDMRLKVGRFEDQAQWAL